MKSRNFRHKSGSLSDAAPNAGYEHLHSRDQAEFAEVIRRLAELNPANTVISSIVAAELWTGVMKSRQRRQSEQALKTFLSFVEVLDWPVSAAQLYGQIRTALEAKGKLIGPMDLLIAAHALSERFTLVTRNVDEFARVEGLKLESWMDRPSGH